MAKKAKSCSLAQTKQYQARQLAAGGVSMTLPQLQKEVKKLGYKLQFEGHYNNNYNRGECWKASMYTPTDLATGKSFAHVGGRRDAKFERLQQLRKNVIVLHKGRIVEF